MTFNGTTWSTPARITDPSGGNGLRSVSCGSASFCAAVSFYDALTYNGTTWSASPYDYTLVYGFASVSCVSASFCVAVTSSGNALTYS